jgi:hypothetical protein
MSPTLIPAKAADTVKFVILLEAPRRLAFFISSKSSDSYHIAHEAHAAYPNHESWGTTKVSSRIYLTFVYA